MDKLLRHSAACTHHKESGLGPRPATRRCPRGRTCGPIALISRTVGSLVWLTMSASRCGWGAA